MRHLPIFLSLMLPAAVQAAAFYHPPDRIPDRDPTINPFQRRINNPQSDDYTCACVTTGSQPETGHDLQQIAKRSDSTRVERRINNPNAALESPVSVAPPVASTCLCPATTAAAPVVNQAPPVATVSPVGWKEAPVPAVPGFNNAPPAQVSYITVQTTVISYSTVQQPVQPKPLQTVYQTHFITSIAKAPHATATTSHDEGKSSDGASATSKEKAPEVTSASLTDADDAPSSTVKDPVIPTSTAKVILNVDKLIVVVSDDDDGRFRVMHVSDQPQPDEFPPLSKDKKTSSMMIYWFDDPTSSDPLYVSHECELELDGIEAQEKTVTFDVKQGELELQKKDGVSFACEKKAKVPKVATY